MNKLVKIDDVALDDVQDIKKVKRRVFVETPLINLDTAFRDSPAGYGREWEINGIMSASSLSALVAKEDVYQGFADNRRHIVDFEDGSELKLVYVIDPEIHERAGYPLSRDYLFRCEEAPPLIKKFRQSPPAITQSLSFLALKTFSQDPPTITQSLTSWLGRIEYFTQNPPTISQVFKRALLQRTTYGKLFTDDGSFTGWTTQGGTWISESGQIKGTSSGSTQYWTEHVYQNSIADAVIEGTFKSTVTDAQCGIILRRTASTTYYLLFWQDNVDYCCISKVVAGTPTDLSTTQALTTNTTYSFKFKIAGTSLSSLVNGVTKTATDSAITGAGALGLMVRYVGHAEITYFDDIKAYKNENIVMNGLADGQKFKIYKAGPTLVATSAAASGGSATLDGSALTDRPPYLQIAITDTDGSTIIWNGVGASNDVWLGDIYTYTAPATP